VGFLCFFLQNIRQTCYSGILQYKEGEWVHVDYVVEDETATGYVNTNISPSGQKNPRLITMTLSTFPKNPVVFGVSGTAGNDFWIDGTIDEIYFWNRVLSKIEVVDSSEGAAVVATVDARDRFATK
tara:strand:+ start:577 stop:954 length:378 start_codon:yes stop_codon:yes gene_type:complete